MRPAATWVDDDQSPLLARKEKMHGTDFAPSHHEHSLVSNLPGEYK